MTTTTIYARVQETAKSAVESYAAKNGMTLTGAVQDLLGLGLEAAETKKTLARLEGELVSAKEALRSIHIEIQEQVASGDQTRRELDALRQAAEVWAKRADITVAKCPSCDEPISGADLLIAGRCNGCRESTSLLMEPKTSDVNSRDLMLVLGAVGVLLGLLVVSGTGN